MASKTPFIMIQRVFIRMQLCRALVSLWWWQSFPGLSTYADNWTFLSQNWSDASLQLARQSNCHVCLVDNLIIVQLCFVSRILSKTNGSQSASVAQSDAGLTGEQEVAGWIPCWVQQHSFVEIDREVLSVVILSLPLIQEGQLSVFGKRMCTNTV